MTAGFPLIWKVRGFSLWLWKIMWLSLQHCFMPEVSCVILYYNLDWLFYYYAPAPIGEAGALGGHRRLSSVRPSVCLMSRTLALTRKPKGLGRRNFVQGYPRLHATPTPTSRSKGQKSRWGGGILWRRPSRTAYFILLFWNWKCFRAVHV